MKLMYFPFVSRLQPFALLAVCSVLLFPLSGAAQKKAGTAPEKPAAAGARTAAVKPAAERAGTVPAVMLSDLHFDPYHDPVKFQRLRAEPISAWQKILAEPDSPTQAADAASLAGGCATRGSDSPWTLLEASLKAAHAELPHPLFVTVSGDLLAHAFECRFNSLAGKTPGIGVSEFATKTVSYVAGELHRTFGQTPIYMALGNNDSGCGDYRESANSDFLKGSAGIFGDALESAPDREQLVSAFPVGGDYSIALPKPIERGRLIVLQDVFLSSDFVGCNGKRDPAPAAAQLEWLRAELTAAHARNEQVWVMAHIPPGVNLYTTLAHNRDVCSAAPAMFLRDEKLVDVLTDFASDIRLAIFAHTHMDEMRLLQVGTAEVKTDAKETAMKPAWIAAKLVPSVSPINGNAPTFTLADVDPKTATLKDYRVFSADNKTGVAANWREDYRYSTAYHSTAFSGEEVARLMENFGKDKDGSTTESMMYQGNFMVGGGLRSLAIRLIWPTYVCSIRYNTAKGFKDCVCPPAP